MNEPSDSDDITERQPLIIASNRLPVVIGQDEDGAWTARPGSGGLVTALAPVLRDRGGLWIGWAGTVVEDGAPIDALLDTASREAGYRLRSVPLSIKEREGYYYGFANAMAWPLFHDLQTEAVFDPAHWRSYLEVNRKFADRIARSAADDSFVWIQDYHLMNVAAELRERGVKSRMGFFLHIPFPPLDIFAKVPWRSQILRSLLAHDLVGFQAPRDRRNFVQCVRHLLPEARIGRRGKLVFASLGEHLAWIGDFPIGIDATAFEEAARSQDVAEQAWFIHEDLPNRKLILGVDRLDYTKGIPQRLEAFRLFLSRHPEWHRKLQLIQVVVPSRIDVPGYAALKAQIEGLVGQINGQFTTSGWVPIHYVFRSLTRAELLGYYRTSEVALITPLKDGMNLVAKEYPACSIEEKGVLILSEFAGAAKQLKKGALLVNPHDTEGVADALRQALTMPEDEQRARMRVMRKVIRDRSVFWWVDTYLAAGAQKSLEDFPRIEDWES